MDVLTPEQRRKNMSAIRSRNTNPERVVRAFLHRLGFRFRLHSRTLPGRPDIVLPRYKTVVFVHGCFWHRHPACRFATTPASRREFWQKKFQENVERDRRAQAELRETGWTVLVVWECQIKESESLLRHLERIRLARNESE
jgi:DNA mismatch endonuclease (patch repair protein)